MDNSPLLKLPREVRELIYEYALISENDVGICLWDEYEAYAPFLDKLCEHEDPDTCIKMMLAGLPMTCKTIRSECLPAFYGSNIFAVGAIQTCWYEEGPLGAYVEGTTLTMRVHHQVEQFVKFKTLLPAAALPLIKQLSFSLTLEEKELEDDLPADLWTTLGLVRAGLHDNAVVTIIMSTHVYEECSPAGETLKDPSHIVFVQFTLGNVEEAKEAIRRALVVPETAIETSRPLRKNCASSCSEHPCVHCRCTAHVESSVIDLVERMSVE